MKTILTTFPGIARLPVALLLAFVAMAGLAKKTIVWENPSVAYSAIPYFEIQKVEMTKEKTAIYVRMALFPGFSFRISQDSYLQTNGKQYGIIGSDSIPLGGDFIILDDSGRKDFTLYFNPLPLDTKEFDFLEGFAKGDYKVFGIHDKDYTMPPASVPTEYIADDDGEGLAEMKFDATPATIHFKSLNYRKGMNTEIQVQYVMGTRASPPASMADEDVRAPWMGTRASPPASMADEDVRAPYCVDQYL